MDALTDTAIPRTTSAWWRLARVDFYFAKAKFYEKFRGKFNERQDRVVARMFREGIDGFKGGLSAENYISITKTSRARQRAI